MADTQRPHPALDEPLPPNYTWNARAIATDSALFTIGISFINATTVLPAFINRLSNSEFVVGLAGGLISGAWLLPQLAVASVVARLPRKMPLVARTAWISRLIFLFTGLMIGLFAERLPMLTLVVVIASLVVFFMLDAVVSVPWFDLVGKTIPARRRGRVLGTSQFIGGLGSIGVGILVRYILSEESRWRYPLNYALLFGLAGVVLLAAAAALSSIREPEATASDREVPPFREVVSLLPRILVDDRPFLRLVVVRTVGGFVTMGNAFYVLNATRNLGLGLDYGAVRLGAGGRLADIRLDVELYSGSPGAAGSHAHDDRRLPFAAVDRVGSWVDGHFFRSRSPVPISAALLLSRPAHLVVRLALFQLDLGVCRGGQAPAVYRHDQHVGGRDNVGPHAGGLDRHTVFVSRRFRAGDDLCGCKSGFVAAPPQPAQEGGARRVMPGR